MTIYRVFATGGNDADDGSTWDLAKATLGAAVTAATGDGDIIYVHVGHTEDLSADTTYTFANNVSVICVDKDNSDALAVMGTSAYIGHSSSNRAIVFSGSYRIYFRGLTFRVAGTTADVISLAFDDATQQTFESCYFWQGNTSATAHINVGRSASGYQNYGRFVGCTFRFGNASQQIRAACATVMEGCTISSDGTAPSSLLGTVSQSNANITLTGCDLSHVGSGNIVGDDGNIGMRAVLSNCKLGASFSALAAQTVTNLSSAEVWLFNCSSGDTHYHLGHYNALGSTTIDTGIYATSNIADANLSWKIVGTANATFYTPYQSPWISVYHTGTSAITPSLECVRSGSASAYKNDTVWSEWSYQGTSGYPQAVFVTSDRMTPLGSNEDQETGELGSSNWTGENATSWFGKLAPASSFTPAEVGHIRARVCVAGANTVYVDPQIRGLS